MDKLTKAYSDYAELQYVSQGRENKEITFMCTGDHFLFTDSKGQTSASFTSPHTSQQIPDFWQPRVTVWTITIIIFSMLSNGPLLQRMSSMYNELHIFKLPRHYQSYQIQSTFFSCTSYCHGPVQSILLWHPLSQTHLGQKQQGLISSYLHCYLHQWQITQHVELCNKC